MFESLAAWRRRLPRVDALCAMPIVGLAAWAVGCEASDDATAARSSPDAGQGSAAEAGVSGSAERGLDAAVALDASQREASTVARDADADAALADTSARLGALVSTLFGPSCVLGRCHTTLAPAGELSLTGRGLSVHDALVNVPSSEAPGRIRVVPYDPAASYLMEKLVSETPAVGTRMPPASEGVAPAQIERVRAWILAGAPDD